MTPCGACDFLFNNNYITTGVAQDRPEHGEQVGKKCGSNRSGQRVLEPPVASHRCCRHKPHGQGDEHSCRLSSGCWESEMTGGWLLSRWLSGGPSTLRVHMVVSIQKAVNVHVSLTSGSRPNQLEEPVEEDPPLCGLWSGALGGGVIVWG